MESKANKDYRVDIWECTTEEALHWQQCVGKTCGPHWLLNGIKVINGEGVVEVQLTWRFSPTPWNSKLYPPILNT